MQFRLRRITGIEKLERLAVLSADVYTRCKHKKAPDKLLHVRVIFTSCHLNIRTPEDSIKATLNRLYPLVDQTLRCSPPLFFFRSLLLWGIHNFVMRKNTMNRRCVLITYWIMHGKASRSIDSSKNGSISLFIFNSKLIQMVRKIRH